jgi:tetratricopeptide (TPR) repeat protein
MLRVRRARRRAATDRGIGAPYEAPEISPSFGGGHLAEEPVGDRRARRRIEEPTRPRKAWMAAYPPALIRGVEGLSEGGGRAVAIAGPPFSGKSRLLKAVLAELQRRHIPALELHGSYRDREVPYAALSVLSSEPGESRAEPEAPVPAPALSRIPAMMIPSLAIPGGGPASARRRGRDDRRGGVGIGGGGPSRAASPAVDGPELLKRLTGTHRPGGPEAAAVVVEDAGLVDAESRGSLLYLAQRCRYHPVLLVVALDESLPSFAAWEEGLSPRVGAEWVRIDHPLPDPRDEDRLRASFSALPEITQRILVLTALQGGSMTELRLTRATRLGIRELADALAPAVASDLIRVNEGQVRILHAAWIDLLPKFLPDEARRSIHREIADGLSALLAEPDLKRGAEIARHLVEAAPDANALQHLREAAEIAERLRGFDIEAELLERAESCLPSLPASERPEEEAELRFHRARALFSSGRLEEAEEESRRALRAAAGTSAAAAHLDAGVETLFPSIWAIGPRPRTMALLEHGAAVCGRAEAFDGQVGLLLLLARAEVDRAEVGRARALAAQAARAATDHELDPQIVESCEVLLRAFVRAAGAGTPEGALPAEEESGSFGRGARHPLRQLAEEVELRFPTKATKTADLLNAHRRAAPILQRMGALPSELAHLLALAELTLDAGAEPTPVGSVERARAICESLHLIPPSPALARTTLLEGRLEAKAGHLDAARELWGSIGGQAGNLHLPRIRAEALLRTALLELAEGNEAAAATALQGLSEVGRAGRFAVPWTTERAELQTLANDAQHGAGALPTVEGDPER